MVMKYKYAAPYNNVPVHYENMPIQIYWNFTTKKK